MKVRLRRLTKTCMHFLSLGSSAMFLSSKFDNYVCWWAHWHENVKRMKNEWAKKIDICFIWFQHSSHELPALYMVCQFELLTGLNLVQVKVFRQNSRPSTSLNLKWLMPMFMGLALVNRLSIIDPIPSNFQVSLPIIDLLSAFRKLLEIREQPQHNFSLFL